MSTKAAEHTVCNIHPPRDIARRRWTLVAASVGMIMAILDVTVVNVALPSIQVQLGASVTDLAWVVDAYTLVFAALMLGAGTVADKFGSKRVCITGLLLFVTASALCGVAMGPVSLIAFRTLQGVGAALFLPSSLAVVSQTFPGSAERARAVGIWGGLAATASAAGPVIGGFLVESLGWRSVCLIHVPIRAVGILGGLAATASAAGSVIGGFLVESLGWRSVFLINVPIGAIGVFLAINVIRPSVRNQSVAMDPLGQIFAVTALGLLSYGII